MTDPTQSEAAPLRNVTEQEDRVLRNAIKRSATLIDSGRLAASPQQDGPSDAEMLDWLTRRIGGIALRDAGVAWPAWSPEYAREAIRAAMRGDTGGKTE